MNDVRPEVQWFAERMEERLKANEWKGGWQGLNFLYLLALLMEEMGELARAVLEEPADEVIHECADVASFAMMIAQNAKECG